MHTTLYRYKPEEEEEEERARAGVKFRPYEEGAHFLHDVSTFYKTRIVKEDPFTRNLQEHILKVLRLTFISSTFYFWKMNSEHFIFEK